MPPTRSRAANLIRRSGQFLKPELAKLTAATNLGKLCAGHRAHPRLLDLVRRTGPIMLRTSSLIISALA